MRFLLGFGVPADLDARARRLAQVGEELDAHPGFLARAPAQIVDSERAKAQEWRSRRDLMRSRIEGLCGAA